MRGRIIEEHARKAMEALYALEVQLGQLDEVIGGRADDLRRRTYGLRVQLQDVADAARMEINAATPFTRNESEKKT